MKRKETLRPKCLRCLLLLFSKIVKQVALLGRGISSEMFLLKISSNKFTDFIYNTALIEIEDQIISMEDEPIENLGLPLTEFFTVCPLYFGEGNFQCYE